MSKGLALMVGSAILSAIAISVNKEGATLFPSVILYSAVSTGFGAVLGLILYRFRSAVLPGTDIETHYLDPKLLRLALINGVLQFIGFASMIVAFSLGGALAIVYTINSLYILIPIILAIFFYKEHWNFRKAFAIALSLIAIIFMK